MATTPGGDRRLAEAAGAVEVGEVADWEQDLAVVGHEPVDPPQALAEQLRRAIKARLGGQGA